MPNLSAITRIFENYYIIGVERYIPLSATLVEKILRDEYNAEIFMMASFGK